MERLTGKHRHRAGGWRNRKLILQVEVEWMITESIASYSYWRDADVGDLSEILQVEPPRAPLRIINGGRK
jgi:hypothetical protein